MTWLIGTIFHLKKKTFDQFHLLLFANRFGQNDQINLILKWGIQLKNLLKINL